MRCIELHEGRAGGSLSDPRHFDNGSAVTVDVMLDDGFTVRAVPGRLSAISVFHSKSVLYGAFVWARRALNGRKRRFSARAGGRLHDARGRRQHAGTIHRAGPRIRELAPRFGWKSLFEAGTWTGVWADPVGLSVRSRTSSGAATRSSSPRSGRPRGILSHGILTDGVLSRGAVRGPDAAATL